MDIKLAERSGRSDFTRITAKQFRRISRLQNGNENSSASRKRSASCLGEMKSHAVLQREREALHSTERLRTKSGRVPHQVRPSIENSSGVHITWKLRDAIPSLRQKRVMVEFERCFRAAKERFGLRLYAYTVMSNHLHLMVTADDDTSLRRGLQGLGIRLAKAVNRLFARTGKVFRDRFHARATFGFQAIKHAVRYALQNARKHGLAIPENRWDPFSSGRFNTRHDDRVRDVHTSRWPVVLPEPFYPIGHALRQIHPGEFPGSRHHASPVLLSSLRQ